MSSGPRNFIRTDAQGYVHAPAGSGLGIEMDWDQIRKASFLTYEISPKDLQ